MGVKIFSTSKSRYLAKEISYQYGKNLSVSDFKVFSDGEFCHSLEENVRGETVFIISSLYSSYNEVDKILELIPSDRHQQARDLLRHLISSSDSVFELLQMVDAAKRASAKEIVAVIPYYGWARQDRKDRARVPITAKMLADIIQTAGATRVMTMDLHAEQIQGFFNIPVDALKGSFVFRNYIEQLNLGDNLIMGSPDEGGGKRVKPYADYFNSKMIFMYKERDSANSIGKMELIGDVEGKDVVFIDDIIDTAGTITKASDILINEKGAKSVRACITHAVLSGPGYKRLEKSKLTELIVTDTIPLIHKSDKIKVISVADLFAKSIYKMNTNESISSLFVKKQ
jgi:ribose-phosphate pyrophosphokinase